VAPAEGDAEHHAEQDAALMQHHAEHDAALMQHHAEHDAALIDAEHYAALTEPEPEADPPPCATPRVPGLRR
jgi:hypothetical protein